MGRGYQNRMQNNRTNQSNQMNQNPTSQNPTNQLTNQQTQNSANQYPKLNLENNSTSDNLKDTYYKDTITISFKQTEYEQRLLKDIISASKQMGKSSWIKIMCAEKLYGNNTQTNLSIANDNDSIPNSSNTSINILESTDFRL